MRSTNVEPSGDRAASAARGSRSTNLAGAKGMVWRDGVTESEGQIRDMTVTGATFTDNGDGTGVLTVGTTAGVPGAAGVNWKTPVRLSAITNGTLATAYENGDTVDDVVLATGDRLLLMGQTAGAENGIYTVNASGAPTRATDADTGVEILGAATSIRAGSRAGSIVVCTNTTEPTVGTTALVFQLVYPRGTITPTQITSNQNDYNPTGGVFAANWNLSTDADRTITGIVAPVVGYIFRHYLFNWGSFNIALSHDVTSTAANRFSCPGSQNVTLAPGAGVEIVYDSSASRWRIVGPAAHTSWTVGTAMPASPSTQRRQTLTDLGLDFYYDGTRWLSVQLFHLTATGQNSSSTVAYPSIGATLANAFWLPVPGLTGGSDLWLDSLTTQFFVAGGTALDASNKWVGTFNKRPTGNTQTLITTITIDSGSSSAWRTSSLAIGALLNSGTTHFVFDLSWTKTGTPGNLFAFTDLTYRIVAT